MSKKKAKIIRMIILLLFVAGVAGAGLYKFSVKDITMKFVSGESAVEVVIPGSDAKNMQVSELCFDSHSLQVKKILIYRTFKSICLRNVSYGEFASMIDPEQSSPMQYLPDSLLFEDPDGVVITLNENGKALLKSQASTFWLERIMLSEVWLIICALAMIACYVAEEQHADNRSNHGPIAEAKRFVRDFRKYWEYMVFAAKADLNAEVANSYLNRLWWLLEPLFSMLVYVVVFGRLMGQSIENYATFVFSALLMWNYFTKTINYSVKLVRNNRDIVTKVYVPKFVLLISNMMLNLFKLAFSMIILIPMLFIFRVTVGVNIFWVIPAYVIMILVSFGAGMIFLHYGVYIDDLSYAVGILLQMMMFLSGIFYDTMTTLSFPLNTIMISVNPMAMLIDTMRNGLLYNTATNLPLLAIWFVISLILCYIGVHIVYKNENAYVKVV